MEKLGLDHLQDWKFIDPPNWSVAFMESDPILVDAKRQLIEAFREAKVINKQRPDGQSPARYQFYIPAERDEFSRVSVEVTHSGRYAWIEVFARPDLSLKPSYRHPLNGDYQVLSSGLSTFTYRWEKAAGRFVLEEGY